MKFEFAPRRAKKVASASAPAATAPTGDAPLGTASTLAIVLRVLVAFLPLLALSTPACFAAEEEASAENQFVGGAPLKTDPELESQMRRAAKFAEDGEYGYAATVWQYVLDKSGDTLMTSDGRTYRSLAEEVERTLTKLPPEGLRVYRITADGEAKAILARLDDEEDALAEVVRRYFISSYGDDAAYKLGCRALDRYDFVGASRLFTKVLELHPDPSVPKTELLLRLAVASARVGDKQTASQYVDQAAEAAGLAGDERLAVVQRDIDRLGRDGPDSAGGGPWQTALGAPHRRGHMRSLPPTVMSSTLTELWGFTFPAEFSQEMAGQIYAGGMVGGFSSRTTSIRTAAPGAQQPMIRWRTQPWRPAGQILFSDGLAMFKTNNDLTAWDASAIGVRAEGEEHPFWRTAWLNSFRLDAATQMYVAMGLQQQLQHRPVQPAEVMLFGDRIHHAMSTADGVVYNVEGPRSPRYGASPAPRQQQQRGFQWGMIPRRSRKNWLAAYEANTGKALWYRSPSESDEENGVEMGFLAAPTPYGELLLAPVTDGGAIWLYALARDDGSTVWKSYLCDEPSGGCSPWSPACVAVDGRDAYVVCGTGVVFALDAVSGQIRFAVRYERHGKKSQVMRNYGYGASNLMELNGWDEDVVVPYGRALVVMATDHDRLLAIDRRTGDLLWDSPRTPFTYPGEYCLGTVGRSYFVAARNVVRRYDIPTGLVKWEVEIDDSFGRGALTEDAVYMPVGNSIWQLDPESGAVVKKVAVSLTTDDPVGNLYSDGERFWVLGGARIYVLTNLEHRLAQLEKRISAGDAAALLDRMRLWAKSDELPKAIDDLRASYALVLEQQDRSSAAATLLSAVAEIHLPQSRPREVLRLAKEYLADLGEGNVAELVARRRQVLAQVLTQMRLAKTAGGAGDILAVAEQFDDDNLQRMCRQTLAVVATADDEAALSAAVGGDHAMRRLIAVDALTHLTKEAVKPELKRMLAEDDPRLQLAAARSLANLGDREALAPLLELLEADSPSIRAQAVHVLRGVTGQQFGFTAYDKPEDRQQAVSLWAAWLEGEGKTAKLNFPLRETPPLLGRTLVASYGQNFLREYDSSGKQVWSKQVSNPWSCQGLPNGHRLVALYGQNAVVEFDENGEEVWRKKGLPGNPFGAQRLENGNTLIACSDSNQVVEVAPDGSTVWSTRADSRPMDAKRLENGNTLICCGNSNRVIEVDREGTTVWKVDGMNGPIKAQRLENGNTLVVQMNSSQVVEVDRKGSQVWQKVGLQQPYDAQRLENGNTLIVDNRGVHEFSPDGKLVWEDVFANGSGVSRY